MKTLGARWDVTDQKDGTTQVVYRNLETGCVFQCGTTPKDSPMGLILQFIVSEGDPGDMVFLNGQFYTQTQKELRA